MNNIREYFKSLLVTFKKMNEKEKKSSVYLLNGHFCDWEFPAVRNTRRATEDLTKALFRGLLLYRRAKSTVLLERKKN